MSKVTTHYTTLPNGTRVTLVTVGDNALAKLAMSGMIAAALQGEVSVVLGIGSHPETGEKMVMMCFDDRGFLLTLAEVEQGLLEIAGFKAGDVPEPLRGPLGKLAAGMRRIRDMVVDLNDGFRPKGLNSGNAVISSEELIPKTERPVSISPGPSTFQ